MHASSRSDVILPPLAPPIARGLRVPKSNDKQASQVSRIRLATHRFKTMGRKIREMPVWLVSLIVHLVVLLTLALMTTSSGQIGRLVLTVSQGHDSATQELVEFSIEPMSIDALPVEEPMPAEEPVESIEMEAIEFESLVSLASLAPSVDVSLVSVKTASLETSKASLALPRRSMFAGRSGAVKQRLLEQSGGTEATEDAVALGLEWLKRQQQRTGNWSLRGPYSDGARGENTVSATAMAMLAFMGSGSTHRGGKYKKELLRAVRWLVKQQDRRGFMVVQAAEHEKMYAQAQAMIALCELYAMTGDSWIRPFAQASCDFAVQAQSPQGGWRYQPRFDSDTSVTGWFVMGLKSGEAAGLEVDAKVWPNVQRYLNSVSSDYYGGYSYMARDAPSPTMTAEGLLCRQYTGWHRNMPGMASGLGALATNHPMSFREPDVYYWYYATQALHHYGGPLWTQWNDRLKVQLPKQQILNGAERGSWSPQNDAWGRHAGRLYTTCFSIYCLEVYYRHMPLYDAAGQLEDAP